ncbi:MAG TPA: HD domain-containing phosphohydrolase [Dissulfurispiraceae bacterium]|nr:HD domain-containing phosphohydrolase [Dissulfurispiraceae bacterium]
MDNCILFVDDEQNILNSLKRLFIDDALKVLTASNVTDGMKMVKQNSVAVIVSDNKMTGMSGIDFLEWTKTVSPDTVRILMTGHADLQAAVEAINRAGVFRFITKPWLDEELKQVVIDSIKRYRMIWSLKKADDSKLLSLAQTVEMKAPHAEGHCERVAEYALQLARALGLSDEIKSNIRYGSWLHDCGKINVPESVLNSPGPLDNEQFETMKRHPKWGADIVRKAGLSEVVINIVLYHHERLNGKGYPTGLSGSDIPFEARIVAIADTYDALTSDRPFRSRFSHEAAIEELRKRKKEYLDPRLVDTFINSFADSRL